MIRVLRKNGAMGVHMGTLITWRCIYQA